MDCGTYVEMRGTYSVLVRNVERKRPIGRPRCRREKS